MALIKSLLVTLFLFLGVAAVHGNDDIRQLLDHQVSFIQFHLFAKLLVFTFYSCNYRD